MSNKQNTGHVTVTLSPTQLKLVKEALTQYVDIGCFSAKGIIENPSIADALEFASTKYGAYEHGDDTNFGTIISVEQEDGKRWYTTMLENVDASGERVEAYHRTTGEDLIHVKSFKKYYDLISKITMAFHNIVTKTLHVPDLNKIPVESPLVHEKVKLANEVLGMFVYQEMEQNKDLKKKKQ